MQVILRITVVFLLNDICLGATSTSGRNIDTHFLRDEVPEKDIEKKVIANEKAETVMTCSHKCLNQRGCVSSLFGVSNQNCMLLKSYLSSMEKYSPIHNDPSHAKTVVLNAEDPCMPNHCKGGGTCIATESGLKCQCPADKAGDYCEKNRCLNAITALGMQSGAITNAQITASSSLPDFPAYGARANIDSCWKSKMNPTSGNEYLQVDFGKKKLVFSVATLKCVHENAWVKTYEVSFSNDGITFQRVMQSSANEPVVFTGSSKRLLPNQLNPPVYARYIRIIPKEKEGDNYGLRCEFWGCDVE